jgi:hydroxypyruvate reductase
VVAGHPVPDEGSVEGAKRVKGLAGSASSGEMVLVLLSGGASSLLALPASNLSLSDVQETTEQLLAAGASIDELNAVRKHLDELKGGGLARLTGPAPVRALVLSDVVGDRLDIIASGPLVPDPTTFQDAIHVLHTRGLWHEVPEAVRKHLLAGSAAETGGEVGASEPRLDDVEIRIIGNNNVAAQSAMAEAARRGFRARLLTTSLEGEARAIGDWVALLEREVRDLSRPVAPPACLVAGGETTVTVKGTGKGGRNQELALAAALAIENRDDVLVACFATDGVDGPTDAAGAWVDGRTVARARERGLDPRQALAANDSYPFFAALGDHITTGPTGTNVMDLVLVLVDVHQRSRH